MGQVIEYLERHQLESACEVFSGLHPADQAELLAELEPEHQRGLLAMLGVEESADILEQMEPVKAAEVFGGMAPPALSDILDEARPEVAADLLKQLPEERSQQALEGMEEIEDVAPLLEYTDESAGGIMTPRYISVRDDLTAGIALDRFRILGPGAEDIGSIVVVDSDGKLVGSLRLVRLALARPTTMVSEIMDTQIVSVATGTDQEECALLMERYDLSYLPVVDDERRLVGVILVDDLVDVLSEEATEDMAKMTGIARESLFGPMGRSIRNRLPWLYLNLATTILAALVVSLFESTISKMVALAVFLPVVAGQGGIVGTQTLTLVVRSIATGDIPERRVPQLVARELALGFIHGILLGLVVGLLAWGWKDNYMLGVVLGLAMMGNTAVAGLAGASTPFVLRLFGLDPALAAAVIVTTITDVVGFLLFLGIAAALISYLL